MTKVEHIAITIRWTARIWGIINLVFLLFMLVAHISSAVLNPEDVKNSGFNSTIEMISFLLFPISTTVGLFIAMKWDGLGGLITIGGIAGFHYIRPELFFDPMIDGLAAPGLLFIIYWLLSLTIKKQGFKEST